MSTKYLIYRRKIFLKGSSFLSSTCHELSFFKLVTTLHPSVKGQYQVTKNFVVVIQSNLVKTTGGGGCRVNETRVAKVDKKSKNFNSNLEIEKR